MADNLLIILFFITTCISIFYTIIFLYTYFVITNRNRKIPNLTDDELPTLDILICAKNEGENLKKNLPNILAQDYPLDKLRIVVVNDASEDDTALILGDFASQNPHLATLHMPQLINRTLPGKKYALQQGVAALKGDLVLLTDADCTPLHPLWARLMVSKAIETNSNIIIGYGAYEYPNRSLLQQFIQWETLHTAIQYGSYAILGQAYMGVGRNLLYHTDLLKKAFADTSLIYQLSQTASGDDDMIISYFSHEHPYVYFHHDTFTYSSTIEDTEAYIAQKRRHTSSSKYYPLMPTLGLGIYALNHFLFLLSFLLNLLLQQDTTLLQTVYWLFGLKMIFSLVNYFFWKKLFHNPISAYKMILLDALWAAYNVILSPYIFWKNKLKWK